MEDLLSFPHDEEVEYKGSDPHAAMNGVEAWSNEQYLRVRISLRGLDPLRIKFFEKLGQKLSSFIPPLLLLFLDSTDCLKDTLTALDRLVFQNITSSETQVLMEVSHPNREMFLTIGDWVQEIRLMYLSFTRLGQTEIPASFFERLNDSSAVATIGFEDIEASDELITVLSNLADKKTSVEKLRLKNCIGATRRRVDDAVVRSFHHEALPRGIELHYPLPAAQKKKLGKVDANDPNAVAMTQGWVNCALTAAMIAKKKKIDKAAKKQKEKLDNGDKLSFNGKGRSPSFIHAFFSGNQNDNTVRTAADRDDLVSIGTMGTSAQFPRLSLARQKEQPMKRTNTSHQRKRVSGLQPSIIGMAERDIPEAEEEEKEEEEEEENHAAEPLMALLASSITNDI